jgi:GNAT superfamily N-acetyltransferase
MLTSEGAGPRAAGGRQTSCAAGAAGRWLAAVRIERFDPLADSARLQTCYEIFEAAGSADDPDGPRLSPGGFRNWWGYGNDGGAPRQAWLATDERGPLGCYLVELPDRENVTLAAAAIAVPPPLRGRGIGTALLAHCRAQAQAAGRTALFGTAVPGSAGEAFAQAAGAAGGLTEIRRVLRPADLTPERLAALRAEAAQRAVGYSLLSWTGPTPDEQADQLARLNDVMADAPREAAIEAPSWDRDRLRATEERMGAPGFRLYSVAARHDESGGLAAVSQVVAEAELPGLAFQGITAVDRPHRGHRLGLLVKAVMHQWLADAEPGLRAVYTWNSQTNEHMIAINDRLGFEVSGAFRSWELDLGAAAPA